MGDYIALDAHKRYSFVSVERDGRVVREDRIEHVRGAIRGYLSKYAAGTAVAVEAVGNWYWIVEEVEAAGLEARLVHARKAKLMMGMVNKTDRLDARGINRLQRNGVLPTVWIPSGELRDRRDLLRTRMVLVRQRSQLKSRLQASLSKYGLAVQGVSDAFGKKGRKQLEQLMGELPEQTRYSAGKMLEQVDALDLGVLDVESRMQEVFAVSPELRLVMTLPGVGFILGAVIVQEVGDARRFSGPEKLASYAGVVPRVKASGGKVYMGRMRSDVNRYLKWAFVEAANVISRHRRKWPERHACRLYERLRRRKGHGKAIGAVARHLAEANYWILKKKESYREPTPIPSTGA